MRCRILILATASLLALLLPTAAPAREDAWRHDSAASFASAVKERVVVSELGAVRLGRPVARAGDLRAARVWALARAGDGSVYAATGDKGEVFRREGDGPWQVVHDDDDTQALALAALPDGKVYAGTGPSGRVIELTDPARPVESIAPGVKYVWALAAGPDGALYAATGPEGGLYRKPAGAAWELVLDSPRKHLLSLAVAPDGTVYAGSDGAGLIYRVAADGTSTVLYDAPQDEIRALAVAPDGSVYAGTASGGDSEPAGAGRNAARPADRPGFRRVAFRQDDPPAAPGTARPKPTAGGENAVYRIGPDGVAREVFRARAVVYALAFRGESLLVGTGPEGRVFELRDGGRESTMLARVDHAQVLALLPDADGSVLLGVGDPGGVLRLAPGYAEEGTLTSAVLDAGLPSRFGRLAWRGERPEGTTIAVSVRTGPTAEPDAAWSEWSPPLTDHEGAAPDVPEARYAQYRVRLGTTEPDRSPELTALSFYYRTRNLPPEITRITVPDLSAADGAARKPELALKWEASDPNDDDLAYTLAIRKDGWPDWVALGGPEPLTAAEFTLDTNALPSGVYRVRVSASDRPSNPPGEAASARLESRPFLIDHRAPELTIEPDPDGRGARILLEDDLTRIVRVEYALDGGPWTPLFPDDGLLDSTRESARLNLPGLAAGVHILRLRATDAAGNVGTGDAVLNPR